MAAWGRLTFQSHAVFSSRVPTAELIAAIRREYALDWWGIHGVAHWARVLENGARLSVLTGARLPVVRLFAVFHDSKRRNDGHDPNHGLRGAEFAATLRGRLFQLPDEDFERLRNACAQHTTGRPTEDITVRTCWDADRLDIGRVGKLPRAEYLSTEAAKEPSVLSWAYKRSITNLVPGFVSSEWRA